MKAIKQFFHMILFIMLNTYKIVETYDSVDETLLCDYANTCKKLGRLIMLDQTLLTLNNL